MSVFLSLPFLSLRLVVLCLVIAPTSLYHRGVDGDDGLLQCACLAVYFVHANVCVCVFGRDNIVEHYFDTSMSRKTKLFIIRAVIKFDQIIIFPPIHLPILCVCVCVSRCYQVEKLQLVNLFLLFVFGFMINLFVFSAHSPLTVSSSLIRFSSALRQFSSHLILSVDLFFEQTVVN